MDDAQRKQLGTALIATGIACIAWSALYLSSKSYGPPPADLTERKSYNQVKRGVHEHLPGGLLRGLAGLGLLIVGTRLRGDSRDEGVVEGG